MAFQRFLASEVRGENQEDFKSAKIFDSYGLKSQEQNSPLFGSSSQHSEFINLPRENADCNSTQSGQRYWLETIFENLATSEQNNTAVAISS